MICGYLYLVYLTMKPKYMSDLFIVSSIYRHVFLRPV